MNPPEFWRPARRLLERHLDRLRDSLEILSERLREALASTVGKAVAEAVRELVHRLVSVSPAPPDHRSPYIRDPWDRDPDDDPDEPPWRHDPYDDGDDRREASVAMGLPSSPRRWLQPLQLGLQTAAWLVRSRLTRLPLALALGLGVFASAAACVSGPSVITIGASMIAGILSLLNLIDTSAAVAGPF